MGLTLVVLKNSSRLTLGYLMKYFALGLLVHRGLHIFWCISSTKKRILCDLKIKYEMWKNLVPEEHRLNWICAFWLCLWNFVAYFSLRYLIDVSSGLSFVKKNVLRKWNSIILGKYLKFKQMHKRKMLLPWELLQPLRCRSTFGMVSRILNAYKKHAWVSWMLDLVPVSSTCRKLWVYLQINKLL